MAEGRRHGGLHVIRDQVVSSLDGGYCLRDRHQAHRGARTGAQRKGRPIPCPASDLDNVLKQRFLNADGAYLTLRLRQEFGVDCLQAQDRAIYTTALYAGLRLGELQALQWDDIDLTTNLSQVSRSWDMER